MQAARDDLAYQEALLAQIEAGSRAEEIAMAQADYDRAVAEYEQLTAGPTEEEIIILKAAQSKAAVAVQEAQAAYDQVSWQPGIGALPQSVALQKASINYEQAKAEYEQALAGPTEAEIDAARSEINKARARLELERNGASEEDVAVAQARIQQARTALNQAQLGLEKTRLVAPFAGTVVAVEAHEGEMVRAGAPLITMADLSKFQVETTDLDEWGVARVTAGQEVILTFKAFEKQEWRGHVVAIAPRGELLASGATVYAVTIVLEQRVPELRWGMTAEVKFVER